MTVNRGKRNPIRYDGSTPDVILYHARNAVQSKDFFSAFDLYEQLMRHAFAESIRRDTQRIV